MWGLPTAFSCCSKALLLLLCSALWLWGGGKRTSLWVLAWGAQELSDFFCCWQSLQIRFEKVSNCKMQSLWVATVVKPKLPERERLCSRCLLSWSRQLVDFDQLALVGPPMVTSRHPQNLPQGSSDLLTALSQRLGKKTEKSSQKGRKTFA